MRMTSPHDLDTLLPELRRQHRSTESPATLEPLLRAAAQRKPAPPIPTWRRPALLWAYTAATLLLALAGISAWSTHHTRTRAPLQAVHQPVSPSPSTPSHANAAAPLHLASMSSPRHTHRPKRPANTESQPPLESQFVALPASEGLPPATAVSLVRMRIQQSALQQYGLEVLADSSNETLLAEFMVGEDGLPRAVRILQ